MNSSPNPYESERLLAEYLLFHYGDSAQTLGGRPGPEQATSFPRRVVEELLRPELLPGPSQGRGLDLGCAVGAGTFALRRFVAEVLGVDFSSAFIRAANELREHGFLATRIIEEGSRTVPFTARVPEEIPREGVTFECGDAMSLPPEWQGFDVVVAANLLCRLPEPRRLLTRFATLVRPGGQLLLATPFSWLPEFTAPEHWLGGREGDAPCFEVLREALEPDFVLDAQSELPMLLREHARKFQYTVSCGSRWIRRS
jgi:putative 4-mercaptohistidine N1-methyltranferase